MKTLYFIKKSNIVKSKYNQTLNFENIIKVENNIGHISRFSAFISNKTFEIKNITLSNNSYIVLSNAALLKIEYIDSININFTNKFSLPFSEILELPFSIKSENDIYIEFDTIKLICRKISQNNIYFSILYKMHIHLT